MLFAKDLIKLKGLNSRQIAVCRSNVYFLEEAEIDGKLVCNVHFSNGRWITAGLCLEEVAACLFPPEKDAGAELEAAEVKSWRRIAEAKRRVQLEVDAAVKSAGVDMEKFKRAGYHVEKGPDGSMLIRVTLEPRELPPLEEGSPQ